MKEVFNKVKDFFKNFFSKKRNVIITSVVAGVLVIAIVLIILLGANNQEKKLTSELESIGRNFYEEFYYSQIGSNDEERASFLSKYSTIGIKVDLENLARTLDNKDEELAKFVNNKTKQSCHLTNSKVTIYPQDPYGKTDYKIDVTLDCGFEKK